MLQGLVTERDRLVVQLEAARAKAAQSPYSRLQVVQRYHFSSLKQRMSVVCNCRRRSQAQVASSSSESTAAQPTGTYALLS